VTTSPPIDEVGGEVAHGPLSRFTRNATAEIKIARATIVQVLPACAQVMKEI